MNFEQAKQAFGSVVFNGTEYAMTNAASADNYGTDGGVRYYASAINSDGERHRVEWDTTPEWDASNAIAQCEYRGKAVDMAAIAEEYGVDDDFSPHDLHSEEYACDWDSPADVKPL